MDMKKIESEIAKLSEEDKIRLNQAILEAVHDREWCELHKINYCNPNIKQAEKILYHDRFNLKYHFPRKSLKVA